MGNSKRLSSLSIFALFTYLGAKTVSFSAHDSILPRVESPLNLGRLSYLKV